MKPAFSPSARIALTVNAAGMVYLRRDLMRALNLSAGCAIELVPPTRYSDGTWYLDVRPTAQRRLVATKNTSPRFESAPVGKVFAWMDATRQLLWKPPLRPPEPLGKLTLLLQSTTPAVPGYYPLRPA